MGVDCFKTDFGERIPTDVVWHDGSDPERMHNYYTFLYNGTVFELLQAEKGEDAIVFARSATVGGQQFPVHWGGDCESNYELMAESLRGGLSLGLSGFGFWSHESPASKAPRRLIFTSAGAPSACYRATAACTAWKATAFHGTSMQRPSMS